MKKKSIYSWKEIIVFCNNVQIFKKCQNLTFKFNFLCQESFEFFNFFEMKNNSLGTFFVKYLFLITSIAKKNSDRYWLLTNYLTNFEPPSKKLHNQNDAIVHDIVLSNSHKSNIELSSRGMVFWLHLSEMSRPHRIRNFCQCSDMWSLWRWLFTSYRLFFFAEPRKKARTSKLCR